jgi:hypothetical protein
MRVSIGMDAIRISTLVWRNGHSGVIQKPPSSLASQSLLLCNLMQEYL